MTKDTLDTADGCPPDTPEEERVLEAWSAVPRERRADFADEFVERLSDYIAEPGEWVYGVDEDAAIRDREIWCPAEEYDPGGTYELMSWGVHDGMLSLIIYFGHPMFGGEDDEYWWQRAGHGFVKGGYASLIREMLAEGAGGERREFSVLLGFWASLVAVGCLSRPLWQTLMVWTWSLVRVLGD